MNMASFPHVLMLSWEFPPRIIGGISSHVYNLSLQLTRLGVAVHVVTCAFPGAPDREEIHGIAVYRTDPYALPAPDFPSWVYEMNLGLQRLGAEILRHMPRERSIIHAHDWLTAKAAIGLKHLHRIPLLSTIHSTEYGRQRGSLSSDCNRMIHETEYWLSFESWRIICCSHYMAEEVRHLFGVPEDKLNIIPNGVNPEEFSEPFEAESFRRQFARPGEALVLYVGRLVYEKGCKILMEAIPRILSQLEAKFVFVGDGYMREILEEEAKRLKLYDRVFFTGFLQGSALRRLYRVADICVIPSLYEPFGITALEAMAAKCLVIASATGGLAEIVEDGRTGITVPPGNPEALAKGITKALRDAGRYEELRNNALRKVLYEYDWRKIAKETLDVYLRVIEERRRVPW